MSVNEPMSRVLDGWDVESTAWFKKKFDIIGVGSPLLRDKKFTQDEKQRKSFEQLQEVRSETGEERARVSKEKLANELKKPLISEEKTKTPLNVETVEGVTRFTTEGSSNTRISEDSLMRAKAEFLKDFEMQMQNKNKGRRPLRSRQRGRQ